MRLEDLRRIYGSTTALDGLNITIQAGELVALLGPSGCGKTTALRLVAGLEDADGGQVVIDGRDVTRSARRAGVTPAWCSRRSFFCSLIILITLSGGDSASMISLLGLYGYAGFRLMPAVARISAKLQRLGLAPPQSIKCMRITFC